MTRETTALAHSTVVRVSTDGRSQSGDRVYSAARAAADSVPVVRTGPTGITAVTPLVMTTSSGRTAFYANPSPATVRDLVAELEAETVPTADADAVVEHDPKTASLPVPEHGPLSVGHRDVLGPCGWVAPLEPADWLFVSTGQTADAAAAAGLLGRGRGDAAADEPVAETWETASETDGDPVVVCNANDASDLPTGDDTLLSGAPMAVLDGIAAVAEHVDAGDAVIYVNESQIDLQADLREAIDAAGDSLPVVPQLVAGPDEFRAGEPTAALEALEGADRIEPRLQPPAPAKRGLYGRPTVIHTPRTFAHVQRAIAEPDSVDADAADPGTRLVTVTGDVANNATVELGSSASLAAVREAVEMDGSFKMACVGGVLGGMTRSLDMAPTAQSLQAAGLGTDGVVELFDTDRCAVETVGKRARFASMENSGRCVPGREGTKQLAELLRDIYDGSFESDKIRELSRVMRQSSNCQTGAHAPRPVTTAIDEFEPEFRAHTDGHCPSGTCTEKL
ncbi:NADH-ubiquinone oxidoreductase-F iron-sulfur binding region domain-containing protein [Haloarcula sp. H-GB4]|uniref:NADH-ubiquinone oxidoreductase-F iron-sulfur binding region domain-containing protein n=1 Tax=Haloarcula sp. H-GB4 TaxID=3069755 RepID=UPI0027B002D6|nr:NADH-ubiquinone oxidoreductase-F iron-sulfur binding region domain-containing protein [Haloarcula sp. H-GB4]MDQ2074328.1 NADH-ubiquinone oxidoreductase-F iron-sulfur binding region domain-containing protein [Haloarcula sp. H-GB4]